MVGVGCLFRSTQDTVSKELSPEKSEEIRSGGEGRGRMGGRRECGIERGRGVSHLLAEEPGLTSTGPLCSLQVELAREGGGEGGEERRGRGGECGEFGIERRRGVSHLLAEEPGLTSTGPLCSLQVELAGEGGGGISALHSLSLIDFSLSVFSALETIT